MTYFLQSNDAPKIKAQNPQSDLSSWFGGLGAAFTKSAMENDANFTAARKQRDVQFEMAQQAAPRVGIQALNDWYTETGAGYDHIRPAPQTTDEFFAMHGNEAYRMVLDVARQQADADPAKWADMDLSDAAVEKQVNERLRTEYEDAQLTLDMMSGGRGAAEFLGGLGGITADIKNLPLLLIGGGSGSLLRVMGREAAINVAAETAFLPSQFEMAERLNIPDPDVRTQLLMAAGAGAVFGGLLEGGQRALTYWKGRNVTTRTPGLTDQGSAAAVDAAEEALSRGENPLEAVRQSIQRDDAFEPVVRFEDVIDEARQRAEASQPELRIPARVADTPDFRLPSGATAIPPEISLPRVQVGNAVENAARYAAAREVDPVTFGRLEELQVRASSYRKFLADLAADQDREVSDLMSALDSKEGDLRDALANMRTGGRRRVKDQIAAVKRAREDAVSLSGRRETPDMARVRRALVDIDEQIRDLAPALGRAYARARPRTVDVDAEDAWRAFAGRQIEEQPSAPVQRRAEASVRTELVLTEENVAAPAPIFSDPASKEARPILDTMSASLRDDIARDGDFTLDLGDGKGERTVSAILDDLDRGDDFADILDLCGKPMVKE